MTGNPGCACYTGTTSPLRILKPSPACPVAGTLPPEVEHKIKAQVEEINSCTVEVVWDPPWTTDMMSEGAKLELGMM